MFLYLFGLPGTGKNYIGRLLETHFGFRCYDADDAIPPEMKELLREGIFPSQEIENQFMEAMLREIEERRKNFHNLVVGQGLTYDRRRVILKKHFPDVVFVLIECVREVRIARLTSRTHFVNLDLCIHAENVFEPITVPYYTLDNSAEGTEQLIKLLSHLLRSIQSDTRDG